MVSEHHGLVPAIVDDFNVRIVVVFWNHNWSLLNLWWGDIRTPLRLNRLRWWWLGPLALLEDPLYNAHEHSQQAAQDGRDDTAAAAEEEQQEEQQE